MHTVFAAEYAIMNDWKCRLISARFKSKEEKQKLSDEYCEAIATKIVSRTTDEELAKM